MTTKAPSRGRPEVDSEQIIIRVERNLLDALDGYIMDLPVGTTRTEALRLAFRDWATEQGYLLLAPDGTPLPPEGGAQQIFPGDSSSKAPDDRFNTKRKP